MKCADSHATTVRIAALMLYIVAALAPTAYAGSTPSQDLDSRTSVLRTLFSEYWQDHLRNNPEEATAIGDTRYNDRWSDYSIGATNRSLQRSLRFASRLRAINTEGLSEEDKLSAAVLLRILKEDQESVYFKEWQMPVNQIHGPDIDIPQLVAVMPFDDAKDYSNYVSRLHKIPALLGTLAANMQIGIHEGRTQPALVSVKILAQLEDLVALGTLNSPFAAPLTHFPTAMSTEDRTRFETEVRAAIENQVLPAYRRFADFVRTQYVPKGRPRLGIDSIPNGVAYYDFCIRRNTTDQFKADQIHRIGLDEVRRDEAEMLSIVGRLGYQDLRSFNADNKSNPRLRPASPEQVLGLYRTYISEMDKNLSSLFGRLPRSELIVESTPSYAAKQKPAASYDQGSADGKRAGRVIVNTYGYADLNLGDVESIAYHEGVPGHHLQMSIAQEVSNVPEFRKQYANTAYIEGWALYSERLGKEIGFYKDPFSDYGRLQSDIWRAIRLVVDTGLHSKGWTRQQVVDFFHDHSWVDENNVQRETDRYIAWPGQALGYKIGQIKFLELRERAQAALEAKFNVRDFHDLVVGSGALPLDVLDDRVMRWIDQVNRQPNPTEAAN